MSVLLGQEKGRKCVRHRSPCFLMPFSSVPTHKHIYIQPSFNPSLTECKPSQPALCDDVAFFSPQGGCWGLKSPAGNPWHPSYPLPFVPWWGNLHLGGWLMRPVAWNQAPPPWPVLCPEPPFLWLVCFGKVPRLLTACRQHDLTLSVHLVPQCTHANSDITNHLPHTFDCTNQYHSGTFNEQLIMTWSHMISRSQWQIVTPERKHLLRMMMMMMIGISKILIFSPCVYS